MLETSQIALECQGLAKRYGNHWVLTGIDLKLRRGESVALFGGNGSGKSTLLKIIATLVAPSAGSVRVMGRDVSREKREVRRSLRFLAHERQLYSSLTVQENLRLAAVIRGLPTAAIGKELERVENLLRLSGFRDRRVSHLSEGMKKRVVLARLLLGVKEPDLILLDEPHPALDQEGKKVLDSLIAAWRRDGKTILLASHDHAQVLPHADRLLVLENGKLAYDGVPK